MQNLIAYITTATEYHIFNNNVSIINPYKFAEPSGLSTAPIHWWDLDDENAWADQGTKAWSNLSEYNTVTVNPTIGPNGQGASFVGPTTGTLKKGNTAWDGDSRFGMSVFAWVTMTTGGSNANYIIDWRIGNNQSTADIVCQLASNNNEERLFTRIGDTYSTEGGDQIYVITNNVIDHVLSDAQLGTVWHHVGYTFDGTTMMQYVDGVAQPTGVGASNVNFDGITTNAAPFCIGNFTPDNNVNFMMRGYVAMAGIWDVGLTESEVNHLYNDGLGRQYADLQFI